MFYCQTCQEERQWPKGIMRSYGKCEVCGAVDRCSDVPSKYLPAPPRFGLKNRDLWK